MEYQPPDWLWETDIRQASMVGEAVLIVPGVWYGANIKTLTEATLTENIRGRE